MTKGGLLDGVLPESVLIDSLPLNNQGIKGMGAALSRINELRGGMQAGYQVCTDGRVKADLSYVGMDGRNSTEEMAEAELSAFRWAKIKGLAEVCAAGWVDRKGLMMMKMPIASYVNPHPHPSLMSRHTHTERARHLQPREGRAAVRAGDPAQHDGRVAAAPPGTVRALASSCRFSCV